MRAQLAATELERAWDRWRTLHGLGTGPLPPVSSYVGYSTEEPWGQPRVVFGMDAGEAEQFAALLDRHDCAGPVYAAMTTKSGARADQDAQAQPAESGLGLVRVPAQGQLAPVPRENAAEPSPADPLFGPLEPREAAPREAAPRETAPRRAGTRRAGTREAGVREAGVREAGVREAGVREASTRVAGARGAESDAANREPAAEPEPVARDGQDTDPAEAGLTSFRPRLEPDAYPEEDDAEPAPVGGHASEPAEAGRGSGGWARRLPGGHSLPRQKRAGGAGKGAAGKQEGKDRAGLSDLAAELAGWAAGELPGEASHRRPSRPDRPNLR